MHSNTPNTSIGSSQASSAGSGKGINTGSKNGGQGAGAAGTKPHTNTPKADVPEELEGTSTRIKVENGKIYALLPSNKNSKVKRWQLKSNKQGNYIPADLVTDVSGKIKIFNSEKLNPNLPEPAAGYDYVPEIITKGKNGTDANAYSHVNGYLGEVRLANQVAESGEVVLKWGDKAGTQGSDIISVNPKTGEVNLWDNKFRVTTPPLKYHQPLIKED